MFDRSQEVSASTTSSSIPTIRTPLDLQDAFDEACHAPRALSALIKTARLSYFDPGECRDGSLADHIAQDLQWGLSKLIDLCIDEQARIVAGYVDRYQDSDEHLLRKVTATLEQIKTGWYGNDQVKMELTRALACTAIVAQRGDMLSSHAMELEGRIKALLKEKQPANGGKKQPTAPPDQQGQGVAA
ncbi:hypothetical protein Despr_0271 [Desulfobulbus propionicus DSM 2032]|uniref:Uncharacterized protein n=1 Tax=Desulfobulbus propionicus (strain ATCC 33891 / DSM 2032 / VKM B-1956 / 1pr3) TaxID=577650 RepID=A0A7U3YJB9_DESPD|nr:hypothetical protein [Desulfobulbus propionicus]ADW16455.1 hypothetical protein Despr_0271 [Desulfobulbus propionicus DSM 2032]